MSQDQYDDDIFAAEKRMVDAHDNWEHLKSMSDKAWQVYTELRDQWFDLRRNAGIPEEED